MSTIDRYILLSVARGFMLILFLLSFLFSLLEFLTQLDDISAGAYHVGDALRFVALTLPRRILDVIPASTLLGSIIALGLLADKNELAAMQANGISLCRICRSVVVAGMLPMILAAALAEFVAPPLEQTARAERLAAIHETDITLTEEGFWARNGPFFVHARTARRQGTPVEVDIFEVTSDGRLRTFTHARRAGVSEGTTWMLSDVEQKTIDDHGVSTKRLGHLTLDSFMSAEQIAIQSLPPDTLSLSDLYQYVKALRERGENADQYDLVLWQKAGVPLTTIAVVLLALPFVIGPTRGTTPGFRIMMGSILGIVIHLAMKVIGLAGLWLGVPAGFCTMVPVAAIMFVSVWLLSRGP